VRERRKAAGSGSCSGVGSCRASTAEGGSRSALVRVGCPRSCPARRACYSVGEAAVAPPVSVSARRGPGRRLGRDHEYGGERRFRELGRDWDRHRGSSFRSPVACIERLRCVSRTTGFHRRGIELFRTRSADDPNCSDSTSIRRCSPRRVMDRSHCGFVRRSGQGIASSPARHPASAVWTCKWYDDPRASRSHGCSTG